MPYTLFSPVLYTQATTGAALATSASLTDISTNPQFVMPPNTITTVGQMLHFTAGGVFSNTATPTLILGIYKNTQTTSGATGIGGAALAATAATTTTTTLTNVIWQIEVWSTFTAVGSSGSVFSYGNVLLGTSATAATTIPIPNATPQTAVTVDTTKPTLLTVGAQWGTSSASNTITCNMFSIDVRN